MSLEGRVAIVTGGARGIGAGIATCLAEDGARVVIYDLAEEAATELAASLGNGAVGQRVDCIEEEAVKRAIDATVAEFGRLDILVNNAGAAREMPETMPQEGYQGGMMNITQENWDMQLAQNLRSTFVCSKSAIPHIQAQGGGAIVNIASIAGLGASTSIPAYGAAKAGVVSLTKSMALGLARNDIRVNAICPGFLWTRAWQGLALIMQQSNPAYAEMEPRQVFEQVVKGGVPLGREQTPEDIGRLAAFLVSDAARNITGQAISVDGGITLR